MDQAAAKINCIATEYLMVNLMKIKINLSTSVVVSYFFSLYV